MGQLPALAIAHEFGIGLRYEQVEQCALVIRLKLVAMDMIEELQPMFGHHLACIVKYLNGFTAGLLIEIA